MCKKILYFSQDFLSSIHFQHRFQNSCCQFQLCFPSSELQFCHLALRLYCTLTSRNLLKAYSYNYRNLFCLNNAGKYLNLGSFEFDKLKVLWNLLLRHL